MVMTCGIERIDHSQLFKGTSTDAMHHVEDDTDEQLTRLHRVNIVKSAVFITLCCTFIVLYVFMDISSWIPSPLRDEDSKDDKLSDVMMPEQRALSLRWMEYDHRFRLRRALKRGRTLPVPRFLIWIHIPKTGTSFVNTLIRWGCGARANADVFVIPQKEVPSEMRHLSGVGTILWDWLFRARDGRLWLRRYCTPRLVDEDHREFSLNMHAGMKAHHVRNAVAFFRLPRQRLYSSYLHINFHYQSNRTSRMTLEQFLSRKRFVSQHAKVLLGRDYRENESIDVELVRKRLAPIIDGKLAFVGLTEQFELSVRLFHAMFGGVPHRLQFENVRPSIVRYKSAQRISHAFRYNEKDFGTWNDEPDQIVYDAAHRRFWRDVCAYRRRIQDDGLGPVPIVACILQSYSSSLCHI